MILFAKFLLAHLIGDFIFQPSGWVRDKERRKFRSIKLYIHTLLHGVLVFLFVWNWKAALVITITHFIIDAAKLHLQTEKNKRILFFVDQLLHLAVIVGILVLFYNFNIQFQFLITEKKLALLTGIVALTAPASITIKTLIGQWAPQTGEKNGESLKNAGTYIGMLERVLVFAFISTGNWAGVGFLLAAKSVFRFGDLRKSKDRKLTEYILIGSLLSFSIAIFAGIAFVYFFGSIIH
jgi:hypothetical protein